DHPRRSLIRLVKMDDNLKVNYGALHGLTKGSILAVYPPAGTRGDKPVGHVRVTEVDTSTSVVVPCQFRDQAATIKLPDQGRCEVVVIDYGDMKVRVAVDPLDNLGKQVPEADRTRLSGELTRVAGKANAIFAAVADPGKADWLLRMQDSKIY